MAPLVQSIGVLGLAALAATKPILPRQEATATEEAPAVETDINTQINITYVRLNRD